MKAAHLLAPLSLALTVICASPTSAAEAVRPSPAETILRQMSDRLAAAQQFSVRASRDAGASAEGTLLTVRVQRPNKFAATSTSKSDVRHFYADGQHFTVFDMTRNHYATVPMRTTLDGLLDQTSAKYGFSPPLAELALSDVYADIRHKTQTITDLGRAYLPAGFLGLGGVDCQRVALTGKLVDAELWIAITDQLPRKMVLTLKDQPGQPQIKMAFSDWNLGATPVALAFTFTPPKGAQKIKMHTVEQITAGRKPARN